MSPIDPETTKAASDGFSIFAKIASIGAAFIGGIVTATWTVAVKVSGYDARIKALEEAAKEERFQLLKKFDRLHKRIDEILLGKNGEDFRHEPRGEDDDC